MSYTKNAIDLYEGNGCDLKKLKNIIRNYRILKTEN